MSEEGGAASATAIPPVPARTRGSWTTFLAVVLAFVIGVAIAIAAMFYFQGRWAGSPSRPAVAADPYPRSGVALRPLSADAGQMLDGRVVQLEERLNRISVEAQAA